jgi:hypothetical protein
MPQTSGYGDVWSRRFRLRRRKGCDRRRRREHLHQRQRWLPVRHGPGMGHTHFDGAVQVMTGVCLRQVPTRFGECG